MHIIPIFFIFDHSDLFFVMYLFYVKMYIIPIFLRKQQYQHPSFGLVASRILLHPNISFIIVFGSILEVRFLIFKYFSKSLNRNILSFLPIYTYQESKSSCLRLNYEKCLRVTISHLVNFDPSYYEELKCIKNVSFHQFQATPFFSSASSCLVFKNKFLKIRTTLFEDNQKIESKSQPQSALTN